MGKRLRTLPRRYLFAVTGLALALSLASSVGSVYAACGFGN